MDLFETHLSDFRTYSTTGERCTPRMRPVDYTETLNEFVYQLGELALLPDAAREPIGRCNSFVRRYAMPGTDPHVDSRPSRSLGSAIFLLYAWEHLPPALCEDDHGFPSRQEDIRFIGGAVSVQLLSVIGRATEILDLAIHRKTARQLVADLWMLHILFCFPKRYLTSGQLDSVVDVLSGLLTRRGRIDSLITEEMKLQLNQPNYELLLDAALINDLGHDKFREWLNNYEPSYPSRLYDVGFGDEEIRNAYRAYYLSPSYEPEMGSNELTRAEKRTLRKWLFGLDDPDFAVNYKRYFCVCQDAFEPDIVYEVERILSYMREGKLSNLARYLEHLESQPRIVRDIIFRRVVLTWFHESPDLDSFVSMFWVSQKRRRDLGSPRNKPKDPGIKISQSEDPEERRLQHLESSRRNFQQYASRRGLTMPGLLQRWIHQNVQDEDRGRLSHSD